MRLFRPSEPAVLVVGVVGGVLAFGTFLWWASGARARKREAREKLFREACKGRPKQKRTPQSDGSTLIECPKAYPKTLLDCCLTEKENASVMIKSGLWRLS